jgi:hypothetical protein
LLGFANSLTAFFSFSYHHQLKHTPSLDLSLGLVLGFGLVPSFGLVLSKWKNKVDAPPSLSLLGKSSTQAFLDRLTFLTKGCKIMNNPRAGSSVW